MPRRLNKKLRPYPNKLIVKHRHFPTAHRLWPQFRQWVEQGGIVRKDLLTNGEDQDWKVVWVIFKAGARLGIRDKTNGMEPDGVDG